MSSLENFRRKFTWTMFLSLATAATARADLLHHWRFSAADPFVDAIGGVAIRDGEDHSAPLPPLGSGETPRPGQFFPTKFVGLGSNHSLWETSSPIGRWINGAEPIRDDFTIEMFLHFEPHSEWTLWYFGQGASSPYPGQGFPTPIPGDWSWGQSVRYDGLLGARPGELATLLSDGNNWHLPLSGIILKPGIDYYVATAFDLEGSTATYVVKDLTNDTPLQIVQVPHEMSRLNMKSTLIVGGAQTECCMTNGVLDEIRLSNRVLEIDELLISLALPAPDLNRDGRLDVEDINLLSDQMRGVVFDDRFDLNGDRAVDELDLRTWVIEEKQTWFGDANLDGQFTNEDLIQVFAGGEYEDAAIGNSTWETGDWNGDGEFDSSDLVVAFQDAGYRAGPRASVQAVPEPSSLALILIGCCSYLRLHTRLRATLHSP